MKNILLFQIVLTSCISATSTLAQLSISIKAVPESTTHKLLLKTNVKGGSGNYRYAWGVNNDLYNQSVIPANVSSSDLIVPNRQAHYTLFVRDKKTKEMAYTEIVINPTTNDNQVFLNRQEGLKGKGGNNKSNSNNEKVTPTTKPKPVILQ